MQEFEKWDKKWEFFQNLKSKQDEVHQKKGELSWALVRDHEAKMEEIDKLIEKEEKKIGLAEKEIEAINKRDKEMRSRKKEVEKEIQDIAKNYDPESERMVELKKIHDDKQRKAKITSRAVEEVQRKILKHEKNLREISKEISKFKSGKCREYEEKRLAREKKQQELELETEALLAQIETSGNHLDNLKTERREAEHSATNAKYEYQSMQNKVNNLKKELHDLESGEKNKLRAFGAWMPGLVEEINRCKKFKVKPIGPLGAHITLSDNVPNDVSAIIEGELGGLLSAFCVNSNSDQMVLSDIFKSKRLPVSPTIITSEFSSEKYDISANRVTSKKYATLVDCIETSNPTVFNAIVDNCQLEKIITIPSVAEAQSILMKEETVPRNLRYAIVGGKHQYFPAPNYKSYYKEYRTRNLLRSSIEELIAQSREQIQLEERQMADCHSRLVKENARLKTNGKMIEDEERKISMIRSKITEKNTLKETLKAEEFAEQPPVRKIETNITDVFDLIESKFVVNQKITLTIHCKVFV